MKQSKYLEGGSPLYCFLPSCKKAFWPECTRGSDGHFYCSQECIENGREQHGSSKVEGSEGGALGKKEAQIATVSECIDHCFAFDMWCRDFARHVDPDDMMTGLDRAFDIVSDATRLHRFLALRKLDDFFRAKKSKDDDLIAGELGIETTFVLGGADRTFLTQTERDDVNKGVAHLTERLTLDPESEVSLQAIVERSRPVFERLSSALRNADTKGRTKQWLDKTDALLRHAKTEAERETKQLAAKVLPTNH